MKLEAWAVGITAGSREVPGRNACDKRINNNNNNNNNNRLCQQFDETVAHSKTECLILEKEQYFKREDRVCAQLHFKMCKQREGKLDVIS